MVKLLKLLAISLISVFISSSNVVAQTLNNSSTIRTNSSSIYIYGSNYDVLYPNGTCIKGTSFILSDYLGVTIVDAGEPIVEEDGYRHRSFVGYFTDHVYTRIEGRCWNSRNERRAGIALNYTSSSNDITHISTCHLSLAYRYIYYRYRLTTVPNLHGDLSGCPNSLLHTIRNYALNMSDDDRYRIIYGISSR